ncbi:hypothetical protein Tco_1435746 [Tanacetum coccineum]
MKGGHVNEIVIEVLWIWFARSRLCEDWDEVADGVEYDPLVGEGVETNGDVGELRCMDRVEVCMRVFAWDGDEFTGSCGDTDGLVL